MAKGTGTPFIGQPDRTSATGRPHCHPLLSLSKLQLRKTGDYALRALACGLLELSRSELYWGKQPRAVYVHVYLTL
jgi:hypothetical protein